MVHNQLRDEAGRAGDHLDASLLRHLSGRTLRLDDAAAFATDSSAQSASGALLDHPAAEEFRRQLQALEPLVLIEIAAYRARPADEEVNGWENMGPPTERRLPGRYNREGQSVLYLAESDYGAVKEVAHNGRRPGYLQEYVVEARELRLVDLSAAAKLSNFVHNVMDEAERCGPGDPTGPDPYLFSQVVADLVRETGFGGMRTPGLRGEGRYYNNIVIFEPGERWREWSRREAGFRVVE